MHKKQSQSGRSMVEMLGVLAIIGVLSVGGIAGYKTAMERHITNQVLQATDQFYLGYLTESANDDSPIYDSDNTVFVSERARVPSTTYTQFFQDTYGLSASGAFGDQNLFYGNGYGYGINPVTSPRTNVQFIEYLLIVPQSACEPLLSYIQSNADIMNNFGSLSWGAVDYNKAAFAKASVSTICAALKGKWGFGSLKGDTVISIGFYFPAE